jgi:hypothetical protein
LFTYHKKKPDQPYPTLLSGSRREEESHTTVFLFYFYEDFGVSILSYGEEGSCQG